jgi:hypothetical protein
MSDPHIINLSTAWVPPVRSAPDGWIRRFGLPAGIATAVRIWLVVESPVGSRLVLNGIELPPVEPAVAGRHAVAGHLHARNELLLTPSQPVAFEPTPSPSHGRCPLPAVIGRVWLEIESDDQHGGIAADSA